MLKKIIKLSKLYNRYGLKGISLNKAIKNKQLPVVSFIYPGEFKHPVYMRPSSSDYATFGEVILDKSYDLNLRFTPEVIIDCGANIGLTSIFFKNKYPNATIIAIEPEKNNFAILNKNLAGYEKIILYNNGIWDKKTNLKIEDAGYGNWGFIVHETSEESDSTIKAISLNDIVKDNNLGSIDILKIDIEGSEKEVFEADYDYWLSKTKVLIIELHDRLRKGASKAFFKALSNYDFDLAVKGQNIICHIHH